MGWGSKFFPDVKAGEQDSCPAFPASEKAAGRAETVAGVGLSSNSSLSSTKTDREKVFSKYSLFESATEAAEIQAGRKRYAEFCDGYYQRCGQCHEFEPMSVLFCRKYNRTHADEIPFAEIDATTGKAKLILDDEPEGRQA